MSKLDEIILTDVRKRLDISTNDPITLEFLNGIEYQEDTYKDVVAILKVHDIPAIKSLISEGCSGLTDNLLIYVLKQKNEPDRLVVVLDEFDLGSDPFVLEILRL